MYAPVTRDGKAGKIEVRELGIGKPQFLQLDALRELESALPERMLLPAAGKYKPREKSGRTAKERKQAAIEAHLLKMESIIKKSKEQAEGGDSTPETPGQLRQRAPSPLSRRASQRQQTLVRPPLPTTPWVTLQTHRNMKWKAQCVCCRNCCAVVLSRI